jgi:hypothetical protein
VLNTNNEINRNLTIIIFNIHTFNSKAVYLLEVYVHLSASDGNTVSSIDQLRYGHVRLFSFQSTLQLVEQRRCLTL